MTRKNSNPRATPHLQSRHALVPVFVPILSARYTKPLEPLMDSSGLFFKDLLYKDRRIGSQTKRILPHASSYSDSEVA